MIRRLALLALLPLLLAAPAHGESWSGADPAGDATVTTYDEEPEPCGTVTETPTDRGDVRRLTVEHGPHKVRLRLRVTGVESKRHTSVGFTVLTPTRQWEVDVNHWRGRTRVEQYPSPTITEDDIGECGWYFSGGLLETCRGAVGTIDIEARVVTAAVPRKCLGDPRWVRVGAYASVGRGEDWSYDRWQGDGVADGDLDTPPLGPRVRSGVAR